MKKVRKSQIIICKKRWKRYIYWRNKHKKVIKNRKIYKKLSLTQFLNKSGFKKKVKCHRKRINKVEIPTNLSLISNPNESIEVIRKIYTLACNHNVENIFLDFKNVKELDICASTIMDTIILEIINKRKKSNRNIALSGEYYGNDYKVKSILEVSGIVKHLGFELEEPPNIKKLELIECGDSGAVSTKVTEYFNDCFQIFNYQLTKRGRLYFSKLVGEIIDNCKLHGGENSKWYTLGHFFNEENQVECQLVIFNFGNTIYESLKDSSTTYETKESLERMKKVHSNYFEKLFWNEEALWTLYALQDGVSRKRDENDPDRGSGTVNFIDSFQKFGDTSEGKIPKMSIISGNTFILFNNKYKLEDIIIRGQKRKVIAFNNENDLCKPPDKSNVKIIKNKFPGTVIALKFYLKKDYIEKVIKEDENENNRFESMCKKG